MAVNDKVATIVKIDLDNTQIDNLINNNNIPGLSSALKKVKKKIENGTDRAAENIGERLIEINKVFFDGWDHPYATGYSDQLWENSPFGTRKFLIDNRALSDQGFPYISALETGTSKMRAKPFASNARKKIRQDAVKIVKENIKI